MEVGSKIVFATDFSRNSRTAMQMLIKIAQYYKPQIYLVHVMDSFWKKWLSGQYEKQITERLLTWQQKIMGKTDPSSIILDKGHVAKTVCRIANDLEANTIIIGSHHKESDRFSCIGSAANNIARLANQSVWIAKCQEIKRILCGVDGSKQSAKALREAIHLAKCFESKLSIVSSIPTANFNPLGMEQDEINRLEEKFKCQHIQMINQFLDEFDMQDLKVDRYFPWGSAAKTMVNLAEDFNEDLIVIGATGQTPIHDLLIGSTADGILNLSPCSLLIIR